MIHLDKTTDTILRGKITITQMKHGYRYGFDAVCLAAFVNGYLRKNKKDLSLADVGSGVGTISLILALKNKNLKISSIENNKEFIEIAKENILKNKFHNIIKTVNYDIFNINKNLKNHFDIVVSNPPFNNKNSNKSNNKFIDVAKRIVDLEKWMEVALNTKQSNPAEYAVHNQKSKKTDYSKKSQTQEIIRNNRP